MSSAFRRCALVTLGVGLLVVPTAAAQSSVANGRIAYGVASGPVKKGEVERTKLVSMLPDGSATQTFPSGRKLSLFNPEYSPDGTRLAWLRSAFGRERKSDGLYVGGADGSAPKQIVTSSWVFDFAWSPDGKTFVYSDVTAGVYSVPTDGSGKPKLLHGTPESGGVFGRFTFTPDGQTVIFEHDAFGPKGRQVISELWSMKVDGANAAPLFAEAVAPQFAAEPDVSPDGKTLLFTQRVKKRWQVVTTPLGAATYTTLFTAPKKAWVDGPTWSPDGTRIAVGTGDDSYRKPTALLLLDPVTKGRTIVRQFPRGAVVTPTWQALPAG